MNETDFKVEPLFAEPLFRTDLSKAISKEQVEYIKNLKMVPNRTNMISEDLYIFKHPQLKSINDAVQAALDVYAKSVMGISQKLYVTQSWSLINNPGIGMHGHSHSNSIISGSLYYAELPEPAPRMIFDRHRTYQQIQLSPEDEKTNIFNTPFHAVKPKKGELFLFSSSLQHLVEPNPSSQNRYSIAFNTFIKGQIGGYRDVSELTL